MDWPLSRREAQRCALLYYQREATAAEEEMRSKDEALRRARKELRRASTGCRVSREPPPLPSADSCAASSQTHLRPRCGLALLIVVAAAVSLADLYAVGPDAADQHYRSEQHHGGHHDGVEHHAADRPYRNEQHLGAHDGVEHRVADQHNEYDQHRGAHYHGFGHHVADQPYNSEQHLGVLRRGTEHHAEDQHNGHEQNHGVQNRGVEHHVLDQHDVNEHYYGVRHDEVEHHVADQPYGNEQHFGAHHRAIEHHVEDQHSGHEHEITDQHCGNEEQHHITSQANHTVDHGGAAPHNVDQHQGVEQVFGDRHHGALWGLLGGLLVVLGAWCVQALGVISPRGKSNCAGEAPPSTAGTAAAVSGAPLAALAAAAPAAPEAAEAAPDHPQALDSTRPAGSSPGSRSASAVVVGAGRGLASSCPAAAAAPAPAPPPRAEEEAPAHTEEEAEMQRATRRIMQLIQQFNSVTAEDFEDLKRELVMLLKRDLPRTGQMFSMLKGEATRIIAMHSLCYTVVRTTVLTTSLSIEQGKPIRRMEVGEAMEVTQDGATGWATVAGSNGTAFLKSGVHGGAKRALGGA
ncbi:unnamed protein product [Prorocentrum cordatum]|uniref:Uncharacterized protein n=2 Tax=Prorocentrum cordatum TaxID=2364126 RepID=A0ABN9WIM2_9DINO|nr:unnamed protein product [Polarella glacialis]